jgi:hypothetical protein
MAIAPLDQRLNTILPAIAPSPTEGELEPMPAEQLPPAIDAPTAEPGTPSMEEGTQVAGFFGALSKGAGKSLGDIVTKQAPKPGRKLVPGTTPEGELPEAAKAGRFKVIPEADQKLVDETKAAIEKRAADVDIDGIPPEEAFNLTNMSSDNVSAIVAGVSDKLGIKTKRVTFDEIKAKAAESGISEAFLARLISPDGRMLPSAVETYKALEVLESSANELSRLFKLVDEGQATDSQKLQLRQQIAFHGLLQKGVKGIQTETARALAVFRIPREGNATVVRQVLDEYGGDRALQDMARSYLTLESRAAQNAMIEKSMMSGVKDIWFSTYINGLLSLGTTHAKNIAGNTFFGLYQIPERLVAGLYSNFLPKAMREGELPRGMKWFGELVPGSADDKIALDEALTMVQSLRNGVLEGLDLGAKAFKTNQPSDLMTKVELQRAPAESLGESLQRVTGAGQDTWLGKAMEYYGTAVTMPGRALMTEDEFFKGVFYRMHINTLITRRGKAVYRNSIEEGMSEADALAKAEAEMTTLFNDPPKDLDEQAMQFAQRGTFTGELPPNLAALQKVFNHPALKIVVPFFKTPANIGLEVIERTPFAPLSSRFRQEIAAGGVYRDMALAKVTLGSTLLVTFALLAAEGQITGAGPKRQAQREALMRTGWKPYSIKIGDNYYTYQGLEPMSALLAIAADYTEYAINEPDAGKVEEVFMGATYGLYEYLKEQPYLQGVAEITKALGLGRSAGELDGTKVINELTKQLGGFVIGGSPLPGTTSLVAGIERMLNPVANDTRASPELPMGVRGFVEAFNRYRSRLPYANESLPEALNLWGDPIMQAHADPMMRAMGMVLPTFVSPEQFSEVDDELVRLGSPVGMPDRKYKGVELNPQQYNRLISIYGKETPAKDMILQTMRTPGFDLLSLDDQQKAVQRVHSKFMDQAKQQLLMEDPTLGVKIDEMTELKKSNGLYYKP